MLLALIAGFSLSQAFRTVTAIIATGLQGPLTIVGALLSALAPGYGAVLLGQVLIGLGCAPAFLVCTVFVARYFEPRKFAFVSGLAMGLGGLGMLFTGTPLAWLVAQWSWRAGFLVLAGLALLAWISWMGGSVGVPAS